MDSIIVLYRLKRREWLKCMLTITSLTRQRLHTFRWIGSKCHLVAMVTVFSLLSWKRPSSHRDLALSLRTKLGDWFRVYHLLKMSGGLVGGCGLYIVVGVVYI